MKRNQAAKGVTPVLLLTGTIVFAAASAALGSTPLVTTRLSAPTITLGDTFSETATLSVPVGGPVPTGSTTFKTYGPADTTCASTPAFQEIIHKSGATIVSSLYKPMTTGIYRVTTSYTGDYGSFASGCNDPGQSVDVRYPALPLSAKLAPATITLGGSFQGAATLAAPPAGQPSPTGSVVFSAYAPGDPACSAAAAVSSTTPLDPAGVSAISGALLPPTAGVYRMIANYPGDVNYNPSTTACGAANTSATVDKATPALTTQLAPYAIALGSAFRATAKLSAPAGAVAPTGKVTFTTYGPGDAACSKTPASISTVSATPSASSGLITPAAAGLYRVITSYGGDVNYNASATVCSQPGALVAVNKTLLGAVTVSRTSATLTLTCQGVSGQTCRGAAALTSHVRVARSKPLAVRATTRRHRSKSEVKRVTDAAGLYNIAAGQTRKLTLRLTRAARQLLSHFGRLPVTVQLNGRPMRTITFTATKTKPARRRR